MIENDSKTTFNLARNYEESGYNASALQQYQKRIAMGGDQEEVFYSLYRKAYLQDTMGGLPEEELIRAYLEAYHFLPSRAEPLFDLINHFMKDENWILGYVLAEYALEIPAPTTGVYLFPVVYEYGLLNQYAQCAYRIGKVQEAYNAMKRLLQVRSLPENIRTLTQKNLAHPAFQRCAV